MFGNQVLNVSGSRNDHPGNGVKTICFMAQNTAIIYIHFVQGKMMVSDVNSRKSLTLFLIELQLFTFTIEIIQYPCIGDKIVSMKLG